MSTTYAVAKAKVLRDLDLEDEEFIQAQELLDYFNEGIREASSEVLTIYEDYLLTKAFLPLTNGVSLYSLPTGIYAEKIRRIVYDTTSSIYEIKRFRDHRKFLDRSLFRNANPNDYYRYLIINGSTTGFQIELSPASMETSTTNVIIWYIRVVDDVVNTTDYVDKDIPQSLNFIYAYVKAKCKQKENAGVMPEDARADLEQQRKLLVETLTNSVPDDDNEVTKEMSFYREMS